MDPPPPHVVVAVVASKIKADVSKIFRRGQALEEGEILLVAESQGHLWRGKTLENGKGFAVMDLWDFQRGSKNLEEGVIRFGLAGLAVTVGGHSRRSEDLATLACLCKLSIGTRSPPCSRSTSTRSIPT